MISGPGGVGKGTIVSRLLRRDPMLWLSRSWTTRPRRPKESADAYRFVTEEEFAARADAGWFLEHAEIAGFRYGTPPPDPPPEVDLLLEIDVQGARQVRHAQPDAVLILVVPPSREALAERMRVRGDRPDRIEARLAIADREEAWGRANADEIVVNDDLERAVEEVTAILARRRMNSPGER
ncbi:MAG TPA: hypothetical protein VMY34_10585 [Acidimicrobiales bacterium]|nr:hypothetical protein [Acidimicrobiales bacterium]